MLFAASYLNLETIIPGIDINPADINPGQPAPTSFTDEPWDGGTTIAIEGPAYSAGLSKRSVTPPPGLLGSVSRFTVSYQIRPSQDAAGYSQCHETDFRMVDASGNLYLGDCQKDNAAGGMWEITQSGSNWVATGFAAGLFPADEWTTVAVVYEVVWGISLQVVSIADGATVFDVPATIGVIPVLKNSGWQPNILVIQTQDGLTAKGGSYTRDMRNVGISMQ